MNKTLMKVSITTLLLTGTIFAHYTPSSLAASAANLSDIKGNWAEKSIQKAVQQGYVSGYPEGTFKPGQPVQIDQFVKMLIMSLTSKLADGRIDWSESYYKQLNDQELQYLVNSYTTFDLNKPLPTSGGWAKPYMNQAEAMGILHLSDEYLAKGSSQPLTREVAARILGGLLDNMEFVEEDNYAKLAAQSLKDFGTIDKGYQYHVGAIMLKGLMGGYPDGTFKPKQAITRAEAVVIIDKVLNRGTRTLFKPNTTGFYPVTFVDYGGGDHTVIFRSPESVKVYNAIEDIVKKNYQVTFMSKTSAAIYESTESRDKWLGLGMDSVFSKNPAIASIGAMSDGTYSITLRMTVDSSLYSSFIGDFASAVFGDNADSFISQMKSTTSQLLGKSYGRNSFMVGAQEVGAKTDEKGQNIGFTISGR